MQGFNMGKYRPPDVDPTETSFNGDRHPLGKRASKLKTEGVLIVRFELPFNIWCSQCNAHLAQGTRYNAHKKHVDDYLGIKVWAFKCKCQQCSSWFEIRTDPQHAKYTVHDGAREQVQDLAVYDTEASCSKTVKSELEEKQEARKRQKRVLELQTLSDARGSDPYTLNASLRSSFRKEKRARTAQLVKDVVLRDRLAWSHDKQLLPPEATPRTSKRETQSWNDQRLELHKSTRQTRSTSSAKQLQTKLLANTKAKKDPFLQQIASHTARTQSPNS